MQNLIGVLDLGVLKLTVHIGDKMQFKHLEIGNICLNLHESNKKPIKDTSKIRFVSPQVYTQNGHWQFEHQMGYKNFVGFIYVIYDKVLNCAYLGKKFYEGHGRLNKGKESNWKKYVSSSKCLEAHFKERPKEEFEFICIEEYRMKGALAYAETWSLCYVEAPTKDNWYNKRIEAISWNVSEGITNRHKKNLNNILERLNGSTTQ